MTSQSVTHSPLGQVFPLHIARGSVSTVPQSQLHEVTSLTTGAGAVDAARSSCLDGAAVTVTRAVGVEVTVTLIIIA